MGGLHVRRDQLWAQRLVTSMGTLFHLMSTLSTCFGREPLGIIGMEFLYGPDILPNKVLVETQSTNPKQ